MSVACVFGTRKKTLKKIKLPPYGEKRQKGDNEQCKGEVWIAFYLEVMIALQLHMYLEQNS